MKFLTKLILQCQQIYPVAFARKFINTEGNPDHKQAILILYNLA